MNASITTAINIVGPTGASCRIEEKDDEFWVYTPDTDIPLASFETEAEALKKAKRYVVYEERAALLRGKFLEWVDQIAQEFEIDREEIIVTDLARKDVLFSASLESY